MEDLAVARAIARAKEGDGSAIAELYLRYAGTVLAYARTIVADRHTAEDVTQQVFARLITAIETYEPRGVPFSAWLLRIARNLAIDSIRRQRAVPCEHPDLGLDPRDESVHALRLALRDSFAELPDGQRQVVLLRHVAGLSAREIADRLGRSEPSVNALLTRGKATLKTALTAREAVPVASAA